jgi:hypothetical protein
MPSRAAIIADLRAQIARIAPMRTEAAPAPTGVPALDAHITGWPTPGVALIHGAVGSGRFGLILPTLQRHTTAGRCVAIIDPMGWLYPPGLPGLNLQQLMLVRCGSPQSGWAAVQLASSGATPMIILLDPPPLRRDGLRLMRATEAGQSTVIVLTERPDPQLTAPIRLHCMGNRQVRIERGAAGQPVFFTG